MKLADIEKAMRMKYGIYYTFYGMKKADSMNRRLMLNTYENGENAGKVYPLSDWTQKDIISYMKMKKLPEPVRYSKKSSGGIGFNLECFLWMRENYPNDLKKILKAFPMSERILFEYDNGTK
ncbi:phosphoadenosine phosphosulfate reductase family protein [Bacteroides fragilis str. 1007-1-F |nr:phosphoadenosine phosphosulfate reductase family protein [Bacteroides fragilis str. 1007-1-F \